MVSVPAVVKLAMNAPMKIPGQARGPTSSSAAIATPVGGQTAEAEAFTNASANPSLAAPKYTAATRA
jgi:hypothetical protein